MAHRKPRQSKSLVVEKEIEKLHDTTLKIVEKTGEAQDLRIALSAIREARQNLNLVAKLTGQFLPHRPASGSLVTWEEFKKMYLERRNHTAQIQPPNAPAVSKEPQKPPGTTQIM